MLRPAIRMKIGIAGLAVMIQGLTLGMAAAEMTLTIKDYATMPMTGSVENYKDMNVGLLSRVNILHGEPGVRKKRFFVNDANGILYIFDKTTRKLTTYLNLNGGRGGIFHKLTIEGGLSNGLISFLFDPDYAHNGKFYTIHLEIPDQAGSPLPDNTNFPGLQTVGYSVTPAIPTPGPITREGVVIEWTDSNISNTAFEGTAREIMRVQYNTRVHPMADMIFNPTARKGDPEWRVLYIASGDGGAGESMDVKQRPNPQRLDTLVGKILRIIPELKEHDKSRIVSDNGRYRIPNDNPFVSRAGARKEIWAYGFRNPTRLTWDVDPADRANNHLIAAVIGVTTWEMVDIIHKGANYGFSLREGNEQLNPDNKTGKLPDTDKIPVQIDETTTDGMVAPIYPVIQYKHVMEGGDAIAGGFVYRGKALPALRGKFIFGDITTGHVWYADFKEMLAADDGDPKTMAPMHEVKIRWGKPDGGKEIYSSMAPVVAAAYHQRGGTAEKLPGFARVSGVRADIRFAMDGDGDMYIFSKSDGMIRLVAGAAME